jgi:hypothetical protein
MRIVRVFTKFAFECRLHRYIAGFIVGPYDLRLPTPVSAVTAFMAQRRRGKNGEVRDRRIMPSRGTTQNYKLRCWRKYSKFHQITQNAVIPDAGESTHNDVFDGHTPPVPAARRTSRSRWPTT